MFNEPPPRATLRNVVRGVTLVSGLAVADLARKAFVKDSVAAVDLAHNAFLGCRLTACGVRLSSWCGLLSEKLVLEQLASMGLGKPLFEDRKLHKSQATKFKLLLKHSPDYAKSERHHTSMNS